MAIGKEGNVKWVDVRGFPFEHQHSTNTTSPGLARIRIRTRRSHPHRPRMGGPSLLGYHRPTQSATLATTTLLSRAHPGSARRVHLRIRHGLRMRPQAAQAVPPGETRGRLHIHSQVGSAPLSAPVSALSRRDAALVGHLRTGPVLGRRACRFWLDQSGPRASAQSGCRSEQSDIRDGCHLGEEE